MNKCSKCGTELSQNNMNCSSCGTNNFSFNSINNMSNNELNQRNQENNNFNDIVNSTIKTETVQLQETILTGQHQEIINNNNYQQQMISNNQTQYVENQICPNCGTTVTRGIINCPNCGKKLIEGNKGPIIAALIFFMVAIFVVLFMISTFTNINT